MVAELLRLRLRVLANSFRGTPARVFGVVLGWLAAIGGGYALLKGAEWLSHQSDVYVMRASVVVGTWLMLAALLVPMLVVRRYALDPRAFLGYPLAPASISIATFFLPLIGPTILLIPLAYLPAVVWADEPTALDVAWWAAPLIVLMGMLLLELGRLAGVALWHRPRASARVNALVVALLLAGFAVVVVVLAPRIPGLGWLELVTLPVRDFVTANLSVVASTPFGMLWAAVADGSVPLGDPDATWPRLWFAVAAIVALGGLRFGIVHRHLQASRRAPAPRRVKIPGWFARFPANPVGAVGARSMTYWLRDPRYYVTLAIVPALPLMLLVPLWVGGVPFEITILVPLPVVTLLVAWAASHNDVAFDSTAFWQHVSAQTKGTHDRQGRTFPVLVIGALLLAVGIPLTVWGFGDTAIAAPLTGVCIALLLGAIGVGSAYSARYPYAAPRPGDPAWQSPQAVGGHGGVAQAMSLLISLLVATPALCAAAAWWLFGGNWGWIALGAGIVSGLIAYAAGVRGGGATIDARGPELLAFTLRN